jgi:glycosyltransferase involved in cell wall biosynthesis
MVARVEVVVPVLNEGHVLARSIQTLHAFLNEHLPYDWTVVIAENGSHDNTLDEAHRLAAVLPRVRVLTTTQPGRGRALRAAWTGTTADVVCYTDVDLSTSLAHLRPLVDAVLQGGYDIAVGSRRLPDSRVTRSWRRRMISHGYNLLLRAALGVRFSDAQTGFKALSRRVVIEVLPDVCDDSWFLDTELLVLAERRGYRIADLPVTWVEDDDSRVKLLRTAWDDVRGVARLWRTR